MINKTVKRVEEHETYCTIYFDDGSTWSVEPDYMKLKYSSTNPLRYKDLELGKLYEIVKSNFADYIGVIFTICETFDKKVGSNYYRQGAIVYKNPHYGDISKSITVDILQKCEYKEYKESND